MTAVTSEAATRTPHPAKADFADVYRDHVTPVWRYVRSRVPDHHAAQDVTSDVFLKALRSWAGFDPGRGNVAGWLFGIAHHAVSDWWRRAPRDVPSSVVDQELAMDELQAGPDASILSEEVLTQLRRGLAGLKDREREAVALRFAAGLKFADVGVVLGITEGAAKMLVARAIERLGRRLPGGPGSAVVPEAATELDGIIDGVLGRGHQALGDAGLRELVLHLAAVHQPPVPPELPSRIASCVGCDVDRGAGKGTGRRGGAGPRMGKGPLAGVGWAVIGPACLACVLPGLWPGMVALGVFWPAIALHNLGLLLAPVIVWLLWRQYRRHGQRSVVALGTAGGALLVGHAVLHLAPETFLFAVFDWAGASLLIAATLVNLVVMRRWIVGQRDGFYAAVAGG